MQALTASAKIASAAQQYNKRDKGIPFGAIIFILFMIFFVFLPMIRSTNAGGRKHRRSGMGPVIIWGGGGGFGGGGFGGGGFGGGGFGGGGGSFGGGGASGGW